MEEFLEKIDLEELLPTFKENGITSLDLLYNISGEILKELIPKIGPRIRFQNALNDYKKVAELDAFNESNPIAPIDIMNMPVILGDDGTEISSQIPSSSSSVIMSSCGSSINIPLNEISNSNNENKLITVPATNNTGDQLSFFAIDDLVAKLTQPPTGFQDFDLKTILGFSPHGSRILNYYKLNGKLNDSFRNRLVDIIMTHLYTYILRHRLTHSQYNILCSKIISVFPNEISQIYYQYGKKKDALAIQSKGKLVYKAHNIIANCPDKVYARKRRHNDPSDQNKGKKARENTEDQNNAMIWLKHHREPWEEVLRLWTQTFCLRQGENRSYTVSEFIANWPIIGDPRADSLIELDFKRLYPEKELCLLTKWNAFFDKILTQKRSSKEINTRDHTLLNLLETLEVDSENLSEDSRLAIQLSLLPRLIPPKSRAKSGKTHWKFSTSESVEGIIVVANGPGEIQLKIEEQKNKALNRKCFRSVQPYLLVEGPTITDIRNTYVVIDKIHFHSDSVMKGLDVLFKTFFVCDTKYPIQSEYIWLLIQKVIFDIPLPEGSNTCNIINYFDILE